MKWKWTPEPLAPGDRERLLGVALSLSAAVDYKGRYQAHGQRVGELCVGIAECLGIAGDALFRLNVAGLLHDVGKLQVPDEVLLKPEPLSRAEYALIQRHPVLGHETLLAMGLRDEARWVLHHHERGDGNGYPSGLRGDEIPVGSRILLVADAWDCMTTDRVYQRPLSVAHAAGEMRAHVGDQFDRDVVDALLSCTLRQHPPLRRIGTRPPRRG